MNKHRILATTDFLRDNDGHIRVMGPPASGKTSALLERYRQLERDKSAGGAVILTYTRESRESLLAELLPHGSARFGYTPVYTYHQMAQEIIGACSPDGSRLVTEMEQAVLLRRLLRRVGGDLRSDYRRTTGSAAFQKSLLAVINTLFQNGVESRHEDRLPATDYPARLQDILYIYFRFREQIRSIGGFTWHDAAWTAARLAVSRPGAIPPGVSPGENGYLLVEDFHDVDPGQYALIRAVAPPGGRIRVNVFGDPTGARFRDRGTSDRFLLRTFPREYDPYDIDLGSAGPSGGDIKAVVDGLLRETAGPEAAEKYAGAVKLAEKISLTVTADEKEESVWIAGLVADLIDKGEYSAGEIAVAVRDPRLYENPLTRAFRDRGLSLDAGRREFSPFSYFVLSLLRLLDRPESEAARNAVSISPFFRALTERYKSVRGVPAGEDGKDLVAGVCEELLRTAKNTTGDFDLRTLVSDWLEPLVLSPDPPGDADERTMFLLSLAAEWQKYRDIVKGSRGRGSLAEFLSLSRLLSPGTARDRRENSIPLYSCREMSSLMFPVVFLAGCSDMLFPALPPGQDYIPWADLQEILRELTPEREIELPNSRSPRRFLEDEHALLLTSLSRATSVLYLSAPRRHRGVTTPAPARVLEGLPAARPPSGTAKDGAPLLRMASAITSLDTPVDETGFRVGYLWSRPVDAHAVIKIRLKRLSPTTIRLFTTCPTQAFYTRILRIDEEPSAASAFGSLFHELMNRLSEHYRTHSELRAVIESVRLDEHISKTMEESDYFARASQVERRAARFHLRDMAARFVEIDGKRTDDYFISQSEKQVGFEWRGWGFGGVADRVDRLPGGTYVVIDYKTGAVKKTGATIRRNSLAGFEDPGERLWQVPLYTRGARPGDAILPEMFCYYVIQPGGDFYPVGLVVGEESDRDKYRKIFGRAEAKRFSYLTRGELDACLDEAAEIAERIYEERTRFDRTDDRDRCARCFFQRVCERTV